MTQTSAWSKPSTRTGAALVCVIPALPSRTGRCMGNASMPLLARLNQPAKRLV